MARYWLAPVTSRNPFTLGGERFICAPEQELSDFLRAAGRIRPPLLLPFKAHLLPADEEDGVCGADEDSFSLSSPGDIVFDGEPLRLSGCAEALLDKLSGSQEEADARLEAIEAELASGSSPEAALFWLDAVRRWLGRGWSVILLKEEP
jgi:hypothetical protein